MMRWMGYSIITVVAVVCSSASADYILQPESGGNLSVTIDNAASEGDRTFVLDFVLSSDAAPPDESTSAIFEAVFSKAGLTLQNYLWGAPYVTGGADDTGTPTTAALPTDLLTGTYVRTVNDPGAVDIRASNSLDTGAFSVGTLLSMFITVPLGFPEGDVTISVVPPPAELDFFDANNFRLVPTTPGRNFTLTVTPEPATMSLLALGGLVLIRRRRRA